jgi:ABC-type branched-subunit amino acid transport system substrate-binding protein
MYLDAMAAASAAQERVRWFVVHESGDTGAALLEAAAAAVAAPGVAGTIAGSAAVPKAAPSYMEAIRLAEESGADMIVALLDPIDQMVFIQQQESIGSEIPTMTFPSTLTQTRDYVAAARYNAPDANPRHRVALWETTLTGGGAGEFNEAFRSRWGEPTDPTAWAAYAVVEILVQAVEATGGTDPEALVSYLESPDATFDVFKGPGVSFRPWDHQLRQPLYDVAVDQEVEWARLSLPSRIAIAGLHAEIPPPAKGDPVDALDRLGNGAEETACRF